MESIQYLLHQQINKTKWDACIDNAGNGLIYGYSFYLDTMAKHWGALVLNDYEAVMPLTFNKKYGIYYLYQPPFIQQLGIFSTVTVSEEIKKAFVTAAQERFRFAELFVNFKIGKEQPNFILPLNKTFELIQQEYKKDLRQNLKHAAKFSLNYQEAFDFVAAIDIFKNHYAGRMPHIKELDYRKFTQVCETAKKKGYLLIRKVMDNTGAILAIALFFKDKKRLYNIMSTVTAPGRQCEANHYLFNNLIKEFSGELLILDFEGSSIQGIASFYQKFGAVNEPYFFLRYNNLPWPFKYFK